MTIQNRENLNDFKKIITDIGKRAHIPGLSTGGGV